MNKTQRRKHDFYETPEWATRVLLRHHTFWGSIIEPCVGDGAIARVLSQSHTVLSNDLDTERAATFHEDAANPEGWARLPKTHWVVTNPPFKHAYEITKLSYENSGAGCAMLLRLTFLEPCLNRVEWLKKNPPTKTIILPRISFTGDGKTDNVTCAWFIWEKYSDKQSLIIQGRDDNRVGSRRKKQ